MAFDSPTVGMAGHVISAALETAGIYRQSLMIEQFHELVMRLALLVYTGYFCHAIVSMTKFGGYKRWAYLITAPVFFLLINNNKTTVSQTKTQYGNRVIYNNIDINSRDSAITRPTVDGTIPQGSENSQPSAKVLTFFFMYDNLVSSVVQQLVGYFEDTSRNKDLIKIAREEVLKRVISEEGDDPDYRKLVGSILVGSCSEMMLLSKTLADPSLQNAPANSIESSIKNEKLTRYNLVSQSRINLAPEMKSYLTILDNEIQLPNHNKLTDETTTINCKEVWQYARMGSIKIAKRLLSKPGQFEREMFPELTDQDWQKVYTDVITKLAPDEETVSVERVKQGTEMIAAFLMKKTALNTLNGQMSRGIGEKENWQKAISENAFSGYTDSYAKATKLKVVFFAANLPYIQGLLLYCLSAIFPLVTIFLLMPTRYSAFFTWMGVWLWVKSWDLGFAIVSFVRGIVWELMPHAADGRIPRWYNQVRSGQSGVVQSQFNTLDWGDPMSILNIMYLGDPAAHQATYQTIVSVCVLAIPVITGQLCLGGSSILKALNGAISNPANKIGNDYEVVARREYANQTEQRGAELNALYTAAGAKSGFDNPGQTADGISRLTSKSAFQRHIGSQAKRGQFEGMYSEDSKQNMALLSGYTGRLQFNQVDGYKGSDWIMAEDLGYLKEQFEVSYGDSNKTDAPEEDKAKEIKIQPQSQGDGD